MANSPGEVYADQWKACADLMRAKADEFDELARKAPIRPTEPEEVTLVVVEARDFIDLAKGTSWNTPGHFRDDFVMDMVRCLQRAVDLLDAGRDDGESDGNDA